MATFLDAFIFEAACHALGSSALTRGQRAALDRYFRARVRRKMIESRYRWEWEQALRNGWPLTAAAIEAERAEWLAAGSEP